MRFNKLLSTLRNGMVSPRLRGRQDSKETTFSAETFDNFLIDKVGGSNKRRGIKNIDKLEYQVFFSDGSGTGFPPVVFEFEGSISTNVPQIHSRTTFEEFKKVNTNLFNLEGTYNRNRNSYIFELGGTEYLFESAVRIKNMETGEYCSVYSYGSTVSPLDDVGVKLNLDFHNYVYDNTNTEKVSAEFFRPDFNVQGTILQGRRVGSNTVCFTTTRGPVIVHRLITYNKAKTKLVTIFITVPWYVDIRIVLSNIGTEYTSSSSDVSSMISPISPYVAQYNPVNTDKTQKVKVLALQNPLPAGVYNAASTITSANNGVGLKRNWYGNVILQIPDIMTLGVLTGTPSDSYLNSQFFIKVPSSDNLYEIVFFVYRVVNSVSAWAIQLTAGMILEDSAGAGSSKWSISSWGAVNGFPEVLDYNNGRLWFAKTKTQTNIYWASGTHPTSPTDIQLFSTKALLQDKSSDGKTDKSGYGFPESTAGNPDAFGFWDRSPNMAKINAIAARRRVHILTEKGECQLEGRSGGLLPSTVERIGVRSNSALEYDIAMGDGKLFYISEEGIRFISTEDADYESQDGLLTTSLEGLEIEFRKIVWSEKHNCLFALSKNNEIFAITHHEDTGITAVTQIKTSLEIDRLITGTEADNIRQDWNRNMADSSYFDRYNYVKISNTPMDIACGLRSTIIRFEKFQEVETLKISGGFELIEHAFQLNMFNHSLEGLPLVDTSLVKKYTQTEIDALYPLMVGLLTEKHFGKFNNNNFGYIPNNIKFVDSKFIVSDVYILRHLLCMVGLYAPYVPIKLVRVDGVTTSGMTPFIVNDLSVNTYNEFLDSPGIRNLTDPYVGDGLTSEENYITVFLPPYVAKIITQPIYDGDSGINLSPVGDIHRIDRATVQVDKSGGFKAGTVEDGLEKLVPAEKIVGENFTGTVNIQVPNSPDVEAKVIIVSDTDTPLHISGVALRGTSYAGD